MNMSGWIIGFLIWVTVLPACLGAHGKYAHKLLNDLFAKYSSALRPVQDTDDVINVTLQITVSQIIDMDERNQILTTYLWIRQVWIDAFLTWKKEDYDGLDTIHIPSSYVWRPNIVLYNNADDRFTGSMDTNVVIRYDGQVMWDSPAITKSSCKVDVSYFPFDSQKCRLTYGSWTHTGNQMDLHNALDSADLSDFVENVEWVVLGIPTKKNMILYGCCSDPYPDITYTMLLKRRASFYIYNLLLPCMMISFLAPLGFYLPADCGEKVSLGVTILLSLTVFQLLVAEIMPPSENIPLIGKYYIATMTMITASTALSIFIMNIHHCGLEANPVPPWTRKFILEYLARICFVYDMGENCMTAQSDMAEPTSPAAKGTSWVNVQAQGMFLGGKSSPEEIGDGDPMKRPIGMEQGEPVGVARGGGEGGSKGNKVVCNVHCLCHQQLLQKNIEYIATFFRDQRANQTRTGEWRKVAKVMDRFFMWIFFIMVFLMSIFVICKAI